MLLKESFDIFIKKYKEDKIMSEYNVKVLKFWI